MMQNKTLQHRRDLYQCIDNIIEMISKESLLKLHYNRTFKHDVLLMEDILQKDKTIDLLIKKQYIVRQYISHIFGFLLPLFFVVFFLIFGKLSLAHLRSGNSIDNIIFIYIRDIRNWLFVPCIVLLLSNFLFIRHEKLRQFDFVRLLHWYKENIKNRPEREINQIIQQVHIPWYKKGFAYIFGVWSVYVLKPEEKMKSRTSKSEFT